MTTHSSRSVRAPDDFEDVAAQQRLAARQDRQAFRSESRQFRSIDPETLLGGQARCDRRSSPSPTCGRAARRRDSSARRPGCSGRSGSRIRRRAARISTRVRRCGPSTASLTCRRRSWAASRMFSSTSYGPRSRANFSMPTFAMGGRTREYWRALLPPRESSARIWTRPRALRWCPRWRESSEGNGHLP